MKTDRADLPPQKIKKRKMTDANIAKNIFCFLEILRWLILYIIHYINKIAPISRGLPTFTPFEHYHRPWSISLLSSEWDQVGQLQNSPQEIDAILNIDEKNLNESRENGH